MSCPTEAECRWRGLARFARVAILSDSELPKIQFAAMHFVGREVQCFAPVAREVAEQAPALMKGL